LLPDQISDDSKRKVLWDNAVDLYRFPASHYPASITESAGTPAAIPVS
jgi:hypothetical protein